MRIAVDAMGGDHAPSAIVAGTVDAAKAFPEVTGLILVGDEETIRRELPSHCPDKVSIYHASEVVDMNEAPATAVRRKKDSSISRCADLVKSGDADAMFSAGNTGAAVVAATLKLRTLAGVDRPAIAAVMPTADKPFVLLDAGANPESSGSMLCQFAVMGSVYSREILGINNPRVGLLSIGEEDAKGNDTTKEAFKLLEASELNFIGNVESKDLFEGRCDVVSCDGFVGNIMLKTSESVAKAMGQWLKKSFKKNLFRMLGASMLQGAFREIRQTADPEAYGGAPLLGCNGICIIGHGSSSPYAVRNGIRVALEWEKHDINHLIVDGVKQPEGPA